MGTDTSNPASYRQAWCADPVAVAKVTKVQPGLPGLAGALAIPECSDGTDIVLSTANFTAPYAAGQSTFGYACARNLEPPHPGDPGGGGGAGIIVGDCVYADGKQIKETRCDGDDVTEPLYKVYRINGFATCDQPGDLVFNIPAGSSLIEAPGKPVCAHKL